MAVPTVTFREFTEADLKGNLAEFNAWRKQVTDAINYLLGSYGTVTVGATLDMSGHTLTNVGPNKQTLG